MSGAGEGPLNTGLMRASAAPPPRAGLTRVGPAPHGPREGKNSKNTNNNSNNNNNSDIIGKSRIIFFIAVIIIIYQGEAGQAEAAVAPLHPAQPAQERGSFLCSPRKLRPTRSKPRIAVTNAHRSDQEKNGNRGG